MRSRLPVEGVACSKCFTTLPDSLLNRGELVPCPACSTPLLVQAFPALWRPAHPVARGETILTDEESSCFHHPEKRAVVACQSCGRFLCSLCDVEMDGRHLCPACLMNAQQKGALPNLDQRRTLFDHLALVVAVVPLVLMWPLTVFTAPIAMGLAVYSFRKPISVVGRFRWRAYLALILGSGQLMVWAWFLVQAFLESTS